MLTVERIEQDVGIEYCAFIDEHGTFNLVSSVEDEDGFNLTEGNAGYIRVSSQGYLQEVEILFVKPIQSSHVITKQSIGVIHGTPRFNPYKFQAEKYNPVIVVNDKSTLILFGSNKFDKCDSVVKGNGLNFYLIDSELVAIELPSVVKDFDGSEQGRWLEARNLI